jgi:ATP-binding cassette subfamily C protein
MSDGVIMADEPTAKLDRATASIVHRALVDAAARRLVIVASHDDELIKLADRHHILRVRENRPAEAAAA